MRACTRMLLAGVALAAAARLDAQTFDFDAVPSGTVTPFSVTGGGLTAAFSSPDRAAFAVVPSSLVALTGQVLADNDAAHHQLLITFSEPLSSISMTSRRAGSDITAVRAAAVPEPGSAALVAKGLLAVAAGALRRRSRA